MGAHVIYIWVKPVTVIKHGDVFQYVLLGCKEYRRFL